MKNLIHAARLIRLALIKFLHFDLLISYIGQHRHTHNQNFYLHAQEYPANSIIMTN